MIRVKCYFGDNSSLANEIQKEMKVLNRKLLKAKDKNTKREIHKNLGSFQKKKAKGNNFCSGLEIACWIALFKGLGNTLFKRLADLYGDDVMSMPIVQYSMHELIMTWSSKELYNNKKDEKESILNEGEAEIAIAHARRLIQSGVHTSHIGVITPYSAQVVLLRVLSTKDDKLEELKISTVDGLGGGWGISDYCFNG
uniref:DNA2/NAM7 helicase-like C-terminal domain-containing protein n=1 Tax=Lactuca sativa TaxID=4236 RepID=A0A9R1WHI2_LACSA|nr:hypothetical protein LSAT_V11C200099690 [Lactuca sativa]